MSDQPKPTGEWTAEYVEGFAHSGRIADAHNAAVAEATDAAVQEMLLVKQQLAAEREKYSALTGTSDEVIEIDEEGKVHTPKPTGEWTHEFADSVTDEGVPVHCIYGSDGIGIGCATKPNCEGICDAHNVRLTAEREEHNKGLREYESALSDTHLSRIKVLEQQLTANREKVQTYEGALIKIANDHNCDRCQVAVDALAKVAK